MSNASTLFYVFTRTHAHQVCMAIAAIAISLSTFNTRFLVLSIQCMFNVERLFLTKTNKKKKKKKTKRTKEEQQKNTTPVFFCCMCDGICVCVCAFTTTHSIRCDNNNSISNTDWKSVNDRYNDEFYNTCLLKFWIQFALISAYSHQHDGVIAEFLRTQWIITFCLSIPYCRTRLFFLLSLQNRLTPWCFKTM